MPQQNTGSPVADGSRAALRALDARRSELNSQLTSLTIRRDLLSQQLRNADAAGQQQLQAMLAEVGNQTARVMKDLAATDAQANKLTADASNFTTLPAPARGIGIVTVPPMPPPVSAASDLADRLAVLGGGALAFIVLVAFARWLWRPRRGATQLAEADVGRMERLQQSIDVIAVEVERIAEGQRHLSKVLADRVLGAGQAEPVSVNREREAKKVP